MIWTESRQGITVSGSCLSFFFSHKVGVDIKNTDLTWLCLEKQIALVSIKEKRKEIEQE